MLRPDLRSGLSDRRGNVISLDLFNFGFYNRSSNILNHKRGGKLVKCGQVLQRYSTQYNPDECTKYV